MDKDILKMSQDKYADMADLEAYNLDENGLIRLVPTYEHAEETKKELSIDINNLEAKLKSMKKERTRISDIQPSKPSKKKNKKEKTKTILSMIFNNADERAKAEEDDDENEDTPKKPRKPRTNTLDTTYGKRFSPSVVYIQDIIGKYNEIITDIEGDLEQLGKSRSKYRSDQVSNLIRATDSKLKAVGDLTSISKYVSDQEYKKDKDAAKDSSGESDSTKAINALGVKFLSGQFDDDSNRKKKKDKSKKLAKNFTKDDYDDDDDVDIGKYKSKDHDTELANTFAKSIFNQGSKFSFTANEKYIEMEGKYTVIVVADADSIEDSWKFEAIDNKTKKIIKDFKDDYPGLLPKKKSCKMVFDLDKMKVMDKKTRRRYTLVIK